MSFQCVKFIFHPRFALNITILFPSFSFFVPLLTLHFVERRHIYYLFVLSNEKAIFNTLSQFNWTSTERKKRLELLTTRHYIEHNSKIGGVEYIALHTQSFMYLIFFLTKLMIESQLIDATVYILCCIHQISKEKAANDDDNDVKMW